MPQVRTHDKRVRDFSAANRDQADGPGWWQEADGTLVVRAGLMNTTPLCWRVIGGSVHLAAQPADLALLDPRPPLDHTVLHAVLRREFPGGDSWFTGVSRVEAGTQVRFSPSSDSVSRERWWRIGAEPPEATPVPDLWGALVAQCERIQQTANRVAVMLSGGIDSSAIAAAAVEAARRAARPPPLLISARYPGLACDETSYQDAVAARLGAPLMAINAAAVPLWPALQNACARYHAPLVDGQDGINLALLEAAWREGVTWP